MQLDAQQVGSRVSVRYRVPGELAPSGRSLLTDVVGRLLEHDGVFAAIERRDGTVVRVPADDIVLARVVPDRPRRTARAASVTAEDLARICTRGWPPIVSAPLGDWELRAAGGFTGRANSVAVHGDPGRPPDVALTEVVRFYAEQGLPARAQVIVGSAGERVFEAAGWGPLPGANAGAVVQVADLDDVLATRPATDPRVDIDSELTDAWMAMYHRTGNADSAVVRQVLAGPRTVGFVRIGDPPYAIGRVVVTGEWAGLASVEVDPAQRRQGLALKVVDAGLRWARDHGATKVYLQTMRHNTAAMRLYADYGFRDHHDYRYVSPTP